MPVFDHLVGRAGRTVRLGPGKTRVEPFDESEPWLASGLAEEALERLQTPNAEVLWLERGGAEALRALGHADLVAATARALRTASRRHLAGLPVERLGLLSALRTHLGGEADERVGPGLEALARAPREDVRVVRGRIVVDPEPVAPWVERLAAARAQGVPCALVAHGDQEAQGDVLLWALLTLAQVEATRARGGAVEPVDAARAEALFFPLAETFRRDVLHKGRRCLWRRGQGFRFAGAEPGEVPDDLPLRALERALLGLARCEPRGELVSVLDPSASGPEAARRVRHAVLAGVDLLRDEGALVPEGPRRALHGSLDRTDAGQDQVVRADAAVPLPCALGAGDLRDFVEVTWPGASPGERLAHTLVLVQRLRARAARLLLRLRRLCDRRFVARLLDLLSLLDRGTIAQVTGVPLGTLRTDLGPRSDPTTTGPGRWRLGGEGESGRRARRRLPRALRRLLPRPLRPFEERGQFARVFPLVRFALLPGPDEVRELARSEAALLALSGLYFAPVSFDRRSRSCPSWRVADLNQARAEAEVEDVDGLVRDVLVPFLVDLLEHRAGSRAVVRA